MSSERSNISLTALCIGVPVLVGASCYYLYLSRNKNSSPDDGSPKGKAESKKLSPLEHVMHLKQIGNQNFSRKNYDVAIEHYTSCIELSQSLTPSINPYDLAIFYQNRAACYEALGKYDNVLDDCTRAIEVKKSYIKPYLRRAKAYQKLENYDKALTDAFSANLLEKFQNQASMILTEDIVKASSIAKATEAMKTHKTTWPGNQTIKSYFGAFTCDPIKEKLNNEVIRSSEQLQPLLDEANKPENDNDPVSLLIRASCLSLMGDMKTAQAIFDKLLSLDDIKCSPKIKANVLIKKAAIVMMSDPTSALNNIEKAFEQVYELLDQAIAIDPENPDIYLHKAQAMTLSEKFDEAIECLNKALEFKEDFHVARAQKLYIEFKMAVRDSCSSGKLQKMLDKFKTVASENPESQDLQSMYAQTLTEMSYFEQADEVFLNMIKLDPTDSSVYVSRALLQFHIKSDQDEVATLLKEALKLDPKIIFAYEILGSIETQRGQVDEAIRIFETALKYAQSESEYARCYSLLDSAKCQKAATEMLGTQI